MFLREPKNISATSFPELERWKPIALPLESIGETEVMLFERVCGSAVKEKSKRNIRTKTIE